MGLCVSSQFPQSSTPTGTVFRDSPGSVYDTPPSSSHPGRPQEMPSPRPSHLHQYPSTSRFPPTGGSNSDHIYAMIDSAAQRRQHSSSAPSAQSPEATLADLLVRKEAALAEVTARRAALEEARVRVEAARGAQSAPFARHDPPFLKAAPSPHQSPTLGVSSIPKGSVPSSRFSPPQKVPPLGAPLPTTASSPTLRSVSSPLPLDSPRSGSGDLVTIFALKEAALADVRAKREALEESKANVERLKAASQSLATKPRSLKQRPPSPTRTPRTFTSKTR